MIHTQEITPGAKMTQIQEFLNKYSTLKPGPIVLTLETT